MIQSSNNNSKQSVGLVSPQTASFTDPLLLACGKTLSAYELVYETYGTLNADASNAILICHALSGDHHAAGYHSEDDKKPGWWDTAIGPGKAIDTHQFFVVSVNNIGGCSGSTGPTSINPETGKHYGPDFPFVTVQDWVNTQYALMEYLQVPYWAAVIGGSLGGMQAMQWSIQYPDHIHNALIVAAAPKLSAQNIAFNEVARQAIVTDPDFHQGHYYENGVVPKQGLILARMLGHITYLSDAAMRKKFGRELREGKLSYDFNTEFQVESYLHYQGNSFVDRFDANSYLLMTKALDYFDPAKENNDDLSLTLEKARCRFLVISFTSDWRFSPERSQEMVKALLKANKPVSYIEITADQGHDSFLLDYPDYQNSIAQYLQGISVVGDK